MNHKTARWLTCCLVAVAAGCVTVNVYFPEAAVKSLSERIEEAVAREAADAKAEAGPESPPASDPRLAWVGALLAAIPAPAVHAAEGDQVPAPEITNPAIRTIISSRASRLGEINAWKDKGAVGESKEALVEIRGLDGVALPDRAKLQKLVRAENDDRERMFKEIAAATGVDLSQLPRIRATYAATLREKARRGDWIQQPDGTWTQKR